MNRETGRNYNGLKTTEWREKVNKSRNSKLNLGLREKDLIECSREEANENV